MVQRLNLYDALILTTRLDVLDAENKELRIRVEFAERRLKDLENIGTGAMRVAYERGKEE